MQQGDTELEYLHTKLCMLTNLFLFQGDETVTDSPQDEDAVEEGNYAKQILDSRTNH
jgi:hypothetical protein